MPKRIQDAPEEYTEHEQALAEAIGARIRQRRRDLKLTQENVRVKMELESVLVSAARFSRIEQGMYLPSASQIIALAAVLGVSYSWLLVGHEEGVSEPSLSNMRH